MTYYLKTGPMMIIWIKGCILHQIQIMQKQQDTSIPSAWLSSSPIDVETILVHMFH